MDDCCQGKANEIAQLRDKQSRVLKVVLAINAAMFFIEFSAVVVASSTAVMADSAVSVLREAWPQVRGAPEVARSTHQ